MFKSHKPKKKHFLWLRGVLFGGMVATVLACLFTPKSGVQLRKKLLKMKSSGIKQGKILLKNSKQHTKTFARQTKELTKNITRDVKDFTKSILGDRED